MVGNAITAKSIAPLSAFNPLGKSAKLAVPGLTTTIPRKPITTEGIAASISMAGFKIFLSRGLAYSEIKAAVPIPKGIAIIIAPSVTIVVLIISGNIPYLGDLAVGAHSIPVIKSKGRISKKKDIELYSNIAKIPPKSASTKKPVALKIILKIRSSDILVLYFILLF